MRGGDWAREVNTLKVQKEARERELVAAREALGGLQVVLRQKDEELAKLAACKWLRGDGLDIRGCEGKDSEIAELK